MFNLSLSGGVTHFRNIFQIYQSIHQGHRLTSTVATQALGKKQLEKEYEGEGY